MNRAALIAALPPAAQALCYAAHIDAADAFLAHHDGLTPKQAASRARNEARSLGKSWPDRLPASAIVDHCEALEIQQNCGLYGADPLDLLIAKEAATAACAAEDAAAVAVAADWAEADSRALADVFKLTRRRVQQIKKRQALAVAQGQGVLL